MLSRRRALCAPVLGLLCSFAVAEKSSVPSQAVQRPETAWPPAVLSQPVDGAQTPAVNNVLSGTVVDPSDASIANAQVHVESTTLRRDTTTDNTGRFSLPLPPGIYNVLIVAEGFEAYTTIVKLTAIGGSASIHAKLAIATQAEEVTVPSGETSTAATDNKSALILKGDNLKTFSDDDDTFQKQIQALAGNGDGQNGPTMYVDGFSGGKFPPKNTIREIRINQNPYSAEYSELGFGRIEIFTKTGTDKFHGQFFVGGNDSSFNTSNPFVGVQPPYHSFVVFSDLSGPINKKTSIFLDVQYNNQQTNAIVDATTLDTTTLQPIAFRQAIANPTLTAEYSGRIDRQVTPTNTLIAKYDYNNVQVTNGGVGLLVLPSEGSNSTTTTQTLQVSDTQIIGAKIVSEAHFQYLRTRLRQTPVSSAVSINVEGAFNGGGSPSQATSDNQDRYEIQEIFTDQVNTKNFFRVGGRYRLLRDANLATANFNGQFTFPSITAYQITEQGLAANESDTTIRNTCVMTAQGQVCGGATQFNITAGRPSAALLTGDLGVFAEDEWKLTNNFTLDLGLRIEMQSAIPDHFDPAPRAGFAWAIGQKDKKPPIVTLRGGGGIFYDRFVSTNILTAIRENGVTEQSYYVNNPDYPTIPTTGSLSAAPSTTYQISPHLRSEYEIDEGISVDRNLWNKGSVSFNYLMAQGEHQWDSINTNAPLPGTYIPATATTPASGMYPLGTTQAVYQFQSGGTMRRERFFVRLNANPTKKLFLFAFYSARRVRVDTTGPTNFPSNSYDPRQDYGPSPYPNERLFVGSFYNLPWGISVNAFLSASARTPFNITTGTDLNGDTIYNDRPAFATAPNSNSILYTTKYGTFDANPQPGEKLIPFDYAKGPAFAELDFGLGRTFKFGPRDPVPPPPPDAPAPKGPAPKPDPRYSWAFGLDAQNIFNDVNAGPPVGVLSSPQFGRSISLNAPYGGSSNANRVVMLRTYFNF